MLFSTGEINLSPPKHASLAYCRMALQRNCRRWNSCEALSFCERDLHLQRKLALVNSECQVCLPEGASKKDHITGKEIRGLHLLPGQGLPQATPITCATLSA